jgi:hypothetical protein
MTQIGAAVKFVSASSSTIGLSQAFDRLLAIGYLGFDVEVGTNGYLGMPIPTFQHQLGKVPSPPAPPRADNAARIRAWLHQDANNVSTLKTWLAHKTNNVSITYLLNSKQYTNVRSNIVAEFNLE